MEFQSKCVGLMADASAEPVAFASSLACAFGYTLHAEMHALVLPHD